MMRLSYDGRSTERINVGGISTPEWGFGLDESDVQLGAALTTVFDPSLIHELRVLFGTLVAACSRANSGISGVEHPSAQFGGNNLNRQERDATVFQLVQNLTWVKGRHTTKFGYDVTPSRTKVKARSIRTGTSSTGPTPRSSPATTAGSRSPICRCAAAEDATQVCSLAATIVPGSRGRAPARRTTTYPFPPSPTASTTTATG